MTGVIVREALDALSRRTARCSSSATTPTSPRPRSPPGSASRWARSSRACTMPCAHRARRWRNGASMPELPDDLRGVDAPPRTMAPADPAPPALRARTLAAVAAAGGDARPARAPRRRSSGRRGSSPRRPRSSRPWCWRCRRASRASSSCAPRCTRPGRRARPRPPTSGCSASGAHLVPQHRAPDPPQGRVLRAVVSRRRATAPGGWTGSRRGRSTPTPRASRTSVSPPRSTPRSTRS